MSSRVAVVIDAVRQFDVAPESLGQMMAILGAAVREAYFDRAATGGRG
jgi:hypothetical protein